MKINKLSIDTSEVILEGEIASLVYTTQELSKDNGNFFSKLFK